jgi:hypothetical protein
VAARSSQTATGGGRAEALEQPARADNPTGCSIPSASGVPTSVCGPKAGHRMVGWTDGGAEGMAAWSSREGKPRRATGLTRWQRRLRQRTLPRSKALKTAGPARRGATCNAKRATVGGDVDTAVEAGNALEGRAPEGKHAAPIRYRASGGNTVNPRVGYRMQQACEPPVEQSGKAVRNREVGTSRPHGCGRPKAP